MEEMTSRLSVHLLDVTVSLTRKLQRTIWTSLAWRNPFPLTTTWKDSEARVSCQSKAPWEADLHVSHLLPPSQMLEGSTARISMQDLFRI